METKYVFKHFMVSAILIRIKPRCSGNFWSSKTNETALVNFSVTSQSHCARASATVLSHDQVNLNLEGATWSFLKVPFEIWFIRC